MSITANSLDEFGLVDDVLQEPLGGAHRDIETMAKDIRKALLRHLSDLERFDIDRLMEIRQARLAAFGKFKEV